MARKPKTAPSIEPEAQQATQQPQASDSTDTASDVAPEAEQATRAGDQAQQAQPQDAGNVPGLPPTSEANATATRTGVRDRLQKHAEWPRILATVREMRSDPKLGAMKTEARERFIWGEMDRLYPPSTADFRSSLPPEPSKTAETQSTSQVADKGIIKGLGDIPPGWPPLPGNAALAAELGWVQANRLYVVEELASGGTRVHLDRAHEPAPSRAAIGWLETSIRSYAKYVEVCAKVSGPGDEDGEQVKRERFAIEEIRELLREMAGNSTGPGR